MFDVCVFGGQILKSIGLGPRAFASEGFNWLDLLVVGATLGSYMGQRVCLHSLPVSFSPLGGISPAVDRSHCHAWDAMLPSIIVG